MTDPAVKTALALCVLLSGVCAALLFRQDQPRPMLPEPNIEQELLIRYQAAEPRPAPSTQSAQKEALEPFDQPAVVVAPLDRRVPPPALPEKYPEKPCPVANSRWGASMDMMLPIAASEDSPSTHTVVDGDTLDALAKRYLGSSERADEIFKANRDVLNRPELLPIGVELKIPPRRRSGSN